MVAQRRRIGLGLGEGVQGLSQRVRMVAQRGREQNPGLRGGFQGGVLVRAPVVGITRVSENKLTQMKITENLEDP